jgi:hypothetical protein
VLCKKIIVAKSKEVKTGCTKSSKEGYGSKRPVMPMTTTMMMISGFKACRQLYFVQLGH